MKISNHQAYIMLQVLQHSLRIIGGVGGYDNETLCALYNEIVNQQSHIIKDLGEEGINEVQK